MAVEQVIDGLSGASVTLFKDSSGKCYFACRGTELTDGRDLGADGLLAVGVFYVLNPQVAVVKATVLFVAHKVPACLKFDQQVRLGGAES